MNLHLLPNLLTFLVKTELQILFRVPVTGEMRVKGCLASHVFPPLVVGLGKARRAHICKRLVVGEREYTHTFPLRAENQPNSGPNFVW